MSDSGPIEVLVGPYSASVETVLALVRESAVDATEDELNSRRADIVRFIENVSRQVSSRVGGPTGWPAFLNSAGATAVHLGAAAWLADALYQRGGSGVSQTDYGSVLYERFKDCLEWIADRLAETGGGGGIDPVLGAGATAVPSGCFPDPVFTVHPSRWD